MLVKFTTGYTGEIKTVIVKDTSQFNFETQLITILLSANLVRYFFFKINMVIMIKKVIYKINWQTFKGAIQIIRRCNVKIFFLYKT